PAGRDTSVSLLSTRTRCHKGITMYHGGRRAWFQPFLRTALLCTFFATSSVGLAQVGPEGTTGDDGEASEGFEEIVVTGSRLRRDTYTSISPLQVITSQVSREVGLIDAGEILQDSTAASGQQIDLTLSAFVTDGGPGASSISLRGLGDARTLVLLNGRRL